MNVSKKELYDDANSINEAVKPGNVKDVFFDYIKNPEFKRLLNKIALAQEVENFKSIAVLSEFSGEGKTFFISVLALGYAAFLKRRVLIMDTISQTRNDSFYISSVLGEESYAIEDTEVSNSGTIDLITTRNLKKQAQAFKQIGFSSNLLENPDSVNGNGMCDYDDELYDTADFQIGPFIHSLYSTYDLILLDTCALKEVSKNNLDPIILAHQADTNVIITTQDSLKKETLYKVHRELSKSNIRVLGTVHNAFQAVTS
jgi:hypothetical protein